MFYNRGEFSKQACLGPDLACFDLENSHRFASQVYRHSCQRAPNGVCFSYDVLEQEKSSRTA
jgi:hypothetical protein